MPRKNIFLVFESILVTVSGGYLFHILHIPLPWVLGPLISVVLWQEVTNRSLVIPIYVRNIGFIILGIYFGLYITIDTFQTVFPYLLLYILLTCILITFCIVLGSFVSRWIDVDTITSTLSCIPGGLSEMAATSDSLKGQTALVVIYQTLRLVAVLFTIPPIMILLWDDNTDSFIQNSSNEVSQFFSFNLLFFVIPAAISIYLRNKIPAGVIIGALGATAILNISPVELTTIPTSVMNAGQVAVGASIGKNISLKEIKTGRKYTLVYLGLSMLIISISVGLGVVLGSLTSLNYQTAILAYNGK